MFALIARLKFTPSPELNESVVDLSDSNAVVLMASTVPVSVGLPGPAKVAVPFRTPELIAAQPGEAEAAVGANANRNKVNTIAHAEKRDIVPNHNSQPRFLSDDRSHRHKKYHALGGKDRLHAKSFKLVDLCEA